MKTPVYSGKRREIKRKTCPLNDSRMGRRPNKAFNYNFFNALSSESMHIQSLPFFVYFSLIILHIKCGLEPKLELYEKTKTCEEENYVFSLQAAGENPMANHSLTVTQQTL